MKAVELLRLYEAGRRDFSGESLRGQNLQGKNLSEANFSGADIRSTNFSHANLTGSVFNKAKAGLQPSQASKLLLQLLALVIALNVFSAFTEHLIAGLSIKKILENKVFGWFCLVVVSLLSLLLSFLLSRKNLEAAAWAVVSIPFGAVVFTLVLSLSKVGMRAGFSSFTIAMGSAFAEAGVLFCLMVFVGTVVIAVASTVAVAVAVAGVMAEARGVFLASASTTAMAVISVFVFGGGAGGVIGVLIGIWGCSKALAMAEARFCGVFLALLGAQSVALVVADGGTKTSVLVLFFYFAVFLICTLISNALFSKSLFSHSLRGNFLDTRIRTVALALTTTAGTSFHGANLTNADFCGSYLKSSDFRQAILLHTCWRDALKLDFIRPGDTYLRNPSVRNLMHSGVGKGQSYGNAVDLVGLNLQGFNLAEAEFVEADLREADLSWVNLRGATLHGVDLRGATLHGVDLRGATLRGVNLSGLDLRGADLRGLDLSGLDLSNTSLGEADLSTAQMLGTNFERAIFTGACLEDWNINSSTNFEGAVCDYVYLKANQQERRPREGNFKSGEFAALFQQALDTVDLIFKDGIDWQAFFQSFQDLRSQYADKNLSIQAIEKKRDDAFVVRLEVAEDADKTAIEISAKELYETKLTFLEQRYRAELQAKDGEIVAYREQSANLMKITEMLAARPPMSETPKYDMRGAQFAGGFAETVQGNMEGGTINNQTAEKTSLTEAAAEIQDLLKQLEQTAPAETMTEKMTLATQAITQIESNPTFKQRAVAALTAGGIKAFESAIDHPVAAFVVGAIEEWRQSGDAGGGGD